MKLYGLDIETDDPDLKDRGASWVYGNGHIIVTGLYDAETKEKIALDGNGGARIRKLLKDKDAAIVGVRIQYDLGWLCHELKMTAKEVKAFPIDVNIAEQCIDEYQAADLDSLARKYLGEKKGAEPLQAWALGKGLKGDFRKHLAKAWEEVPDLVRAYVISDADQPVRIWEKQERELIANGGYKMTVTNCKLIKIVLGMKQRGVRIDMDRRKENFLRISKIQKELKKDFTGKYGDVNFNSPKQLAELFDREKVPYRRKIRIKGLVGEPPLVGGQLWEMKTRLKQIVNGVRVIKGQLVLYVPNQYSGRTNAELQSYGFVTTCNPSIDKKALAILKRQYPVAGEIVDLKQVTSIIDKFLGPGFDRFIVKHGENNYRIHADFNIVGARQTGRFSSCFSGDTLVDTTKGKKRIEDIQAGDMVFTHTGAVARVASRIDRGTKPAYLLTTDAPSDIICTKDHPFVSMRGWEPLEKCSEVLYVGEKYIGQEDYRKDSCSVPVKGKAYCGGGCKVHIGNASDCQKGTRGPSHFRAVVSGKIPALLTRKNSWFECHAWENFGKAPCMEGDNIGQQGSSYHKDSGWIKTICAQGRDGQRAGLTNISAAEVRYTPYRRGRGKQLAGQFSTCHKERTREASSGMVSVKGLTFVGEIPVFDLSIEHEDHSFIANGYAVHNCNPNLQQIPSKTVLFQGDKEKEIKLYKLCREIIIPDEGYILGKADYSGQENRIMAHFAVGTGSVEIRRMYNENPELDFHAYIGEVSGLYAEYGEDIGRKYAKNCSFGLGYGMMITTMMETFGWSREQAERITQLYNDGAPFVRETMDKVSEVIISRGYIVTLGGRHAHLRKYNGRVDTRSAYKGFNKLIQGSAADMTKEAIVQLDEAGLLDIFPLLLQVHDEIDFLIPKSIEALNRLPELRHIMEHPIEMVVPIRVDPEVGTTWANVAGQRKHKVTKEKESMKHFIARVAKTDNFAA